jgi:hypothetical protein
VEIHDKHCVEIHDEHYVEIHDKHCVSMVGSKCAGTEGMYHKHAVAGITPNTLENTLKESEYFFKFAKKKGR